MSDTYYQDHCGRHLDASFDAALKTFLNKGMSWLPWIGRDFSKSAGKILIVGESNYTDEQDPGKVAEKKAERQGDKLYQRGVVVEYPLVGKEADWKKNSPTFDNLHRALLKTSLLEPEDMEKRGRLWDHLAYHNIVQNVMDFGGEGRPRQRPSDEDFSNGWRLFVQLIEVIHPKTCVFIGVQASKSFNNTMHNIGIQHVPIQNGKKRNGAYERNGGSVTINGETTNLVFMKHTSRYFKWELWNDYLETIMPDTMADLRDRVFNQPTTIQL